MKKRILSTFLAILPFFSAISGLPSVIDFGTYPIIEYGYYNPFLPEAWNLGYYSFNQAPEISPIFARLKKDYQIDTAIETGTFIGGTTVFLSSLFEHVHTIEIQEQFYQSMLESFKPFPNIHPHLGSSEKILAELLPSLKNKRILFYLDAHWNAFWPLLDELEEISKTHQDNCIIVIDDFKVPGRGDIPYDAYGSHECSIEYIKNHLDKIFTSYTVHYLIPRSVHSRAKCIIIPHKFKNMVDDLRKRIENHPPKIKK